MKKRILALLMIVVLLAPLAEPARAAQTAAGQTEDSLVLLDTIQLSDANDGEEHTFPEPISEPLPELPEEGFLTEPDEPLPEPDDQGFLAEIGAPDADATVITTAAELQALGQSGSYVLGADIDLSGETDWATISVSVLGNLTLDGQGHTIRGLPVSLLYLGNSKTISVTVRNLRLELAEGFSSCAALITNYKNTPIPLTLDNCVVVGDITYPSSTGADGIGGLVAAYGSSGTITHCAYYGNISAVSGKVGGIAGSFSGTIHDCYMQGSVTATHEVYASYVGGIVGYHSGASMPLRRCTAVITGDVSGLYNAGGIVGYTNKDVSDCRTFLTGEGQIVHTAGTGGSSTDTRAVGGVAGYAANVSNCYCRGGSCTGSYAVGGVVGWLTGSCAGSYAADIQILSSFDAGGVVGGGVTSTVITDCVADTAVTTRSTYYTCGAGGVVGVGGYIERCYATGSVTGNNGSETIGLGEAVGGIAGSCVSVSDSTATVALSGSRVGGIAGAGDVRNCYMDGITVSGVSYAGAIMGDGTAQGCAVWDVMVSSDGGYAGAVTGRGEANSCSSVRGTVTGTYAGGLVGTGGGSNSTVTGGTVTGITGAGGLIGTSYSNLYCTDCTVSWLTVTADETSGAAGGLAGVGGRHVGCTAEHMTVTGFNAGGLTGSDGTLQGCVASGGTITATSAAGGITGCVSSGSFSSCTVRNMTVKGEIYAGGALGYCGASSSGTSFSFCQVEGGLVDATAPYDESTHDVKACVGGLIGYSESYSEIRLSDFNGVLGSQGYYIGGLIGYMSIPRASNKIVYKLEQCHSTVPQNLSCSSPIGYIGGLVGYIGYSYYYVNSASICISNCTTKGMSASLTNASGLGGLVGYVDSGTPLRLEHCTVDGDLSMMSIDDNYAGGLIAVSCGNVYTADCWINGDVVFTSGNSSRTRCLIGTTWAPSDETFYYYYYQSGIVAEAGDPSYSIITNGSVDTASLYGTCDRVKIKELTSYTYQSDSAVTRPVTVTVYGGIYGQASTAPLKGATVTVGTETAYTNESGVATLYCSTDAFGAPVTLTVTREGYPDYQGACTFTTNQPFTSVTLWRLDPGQIRVTGGTVQLSATRTRKLFGSEKVKFVQNDERCYDVEIQVAWNGHTPSQVLLKGASSGRTVALTPTKYGAYGSVCFGTSFDADEAILVEAIAKPEAEYGDIRKSALTCWQVTPLKVKILVEDPVETTMTDGKEESTFFLNGMGVKINLGDLAKCATSVSYENGVVTLCFNAKDSEKEQGSLFTTGDVSHKDTVSVSGTVSVPIADPDADWTAKLKVGINDSLSVATDGTEIKRDDAKQKANYTKTFNFTVMGVPCYVETSLGSSGSAAIELYGPAYDLEQVRASGTMAVGVEGSAGGGLGGSTELVQYNDKPGIELKIGVEGKLTADLKGKFDTGNLESPFSVVPTFGGELNGKASVRVFFLDLSKKLTFGSFKWDPTNGLTWETIFDEEETAQLMDLSEGETWQLLGRSYLANGGGYVGGMPSLMAVTGSAATVYENISPAAETAQTVSSSGAMLYYTAERPEVEAQQNAMTLYCVVGTSSPVALDATETADYNPAASGSFVVWQDTKTSEAVLFDHLMNSEIAVSCYDGSAFAEKTILTDEDENSYVFAPAVAASGQGSTAQAIAAWLCALGVTEDTVFQPETVEIWYALYDGSAWGAARRAAEVSGTVSTLTADYTGSAFVLDYQTGSDVYEITVTPGSGEETGGTVDEPVLSQENARFYTRANGTRSWVDNEGVLHVEEPSGAAGAPKSGAISLYGAPSETPVLAAYNSAAGISCYQIYWVQGTQIYSSTSAASGAWSAPTLLCTEEGPVRELSVRVSGASASAAPTLAYLVDTDSGAELRTLTPSICMPVLTSLTQYAGTLEAVIRNEGFDSDAAENYRRFTWILTNESGATVLSGITDAVAPGTETTVVIDRTALGAGTYTLSLVNQTSGIAGQPYTFTLDAPFATVAIEDAYWENGSLWVQVRSGGTPSGDLTLTLFDENGGAAASVTVTDSELGLPYLAELPGGSLAQGVYLLCAEISGATDSMLVCNIKDSGSDTGTLLVDSWTAGDSASTVNLIGSGTLLTGDVLVFAASYGSGGQMLQMTSGTLQPGGDSVTFPCRLEAGWTLFFLDSRTCAPLAGKLVLQ